MVQLEFEKFFPDESGCILHFRDIRLAQGIKCRTCSGTKHYWLASKLQFQCKRCKSRLNLRSGTLLEASNMPIRFWYQILFLYVRSNGNIEAIEIQRILKSKRTTTVKFILSKIRLSFSVQSLNQEEWSDNLVKSILVVYPS